MASPTTVTQPTKGPTVDSTLATVEVALQLEAYTLSDAAATTAADATQALRTDHAHGRARVAQDTQAFRDAWAKAQRAEKAADRRAAWRCWDAQICVAIRAFVEAQRIADAERDRRWAAQREQWDAQQKQWATEKEQRDAKWAAWLAEKEERDAEWAAQRARWAAEQEQRDAECAAECTRVKAELAAIRA
ncbi:hypothetical protein HYPSUDRAFT_206637 [Hypholoma sublateritium FD-334 SS-4]|uniref:Uncharacterized protein n=1 Tax=Hypholoma sublateritium (strain FD-334 SS-4) TaxID=945553 RepID=A0A0D2M197_HYPSF|nr:hypothetical protein HYPSUDRAFT_206637 [Hypholoma sublateritium FD-334 SS-4]